MAFRLVAVLRQDGCVWAISGVSLGLFLLGQERLLRLPVHLAFLLTGSLKLRHVRLALPADLVGDATEHTKAAARLQPRDAERIGDNLSEMASAEVTS